MFVCEKDIREYRWKNSSATTCVGVDKYVQAYKQYSIDSGVTWNDVIPYEYSATTLIEKESFDCGYSPLAQSGQPFTIVREDGEDLFVFSSSYGAEYNVGGGWYRFIVNPVRVTDKIKIRVSTNREPPANIKISGSSYSFEGNIASLYVTDLSNGTLYLSDDMFGGFFANLEGLKSAKKLYLPIPNYLRRGCYAGMFKGCINLEKAPVLYTDRPVQYCYSNMFNGCTSLNDIVCLATDISATFASEKWVNGVAANGTFHKNPNATVCQSGCTWSTGVNGIPSGWTITDYTG